ncbi:iron-siderophore ABC transporter substrate-binding protein [Streptomyces sp. CMB-StM0423]|uniref:iron-siderophore ABC transporter substrate-binding protein n=1 Tax=Streptomyces sp. CMB-StM0423 TaxID=2059884 RepID=UPI000C713186|nr:iron-siderophore ABC transporter substrate-binding protein [Streptomyces sp. CMB-StM0423]AUH42068.1 ABC transporter substrate-binding protein [Streptomyces sp. CMB-StM0423]
MKRLLLTAAVATAATLTLAACGTTEDAADDDDKGGAGKGAAQPITLTDSNGKKVTLENGPATKVVGTEWNVVESLVSLGVDPVGVADVKGYRTWDTAVPLTGEPKEIGTRGEPSIDTIAALNPDLVIATTDLPESAVKQLGEHAPVLTLRSADAADPLGQMTENLDLIAKATGTTDRAEKLKADFDAKLDEGKKAIDEAGLGGKKIATADGYVVSNQVSIRAFTAGSQLGAVNERLGLENSWDVKGDKDYGLGSTDVEGLTKLPGDTQFVYVANDKDEASTPFTGVLKDNSVWKSLPFVKAGDVHRIEDGTWMFGAIGSMNQYVDSLVAELTK